MHTANIRAAAVLVTTALAIGAGCAGAQTSEWRPFISVTPVWDGETDLDSGGEFDVVRASVRAGLTRDFSRDFHGGVTFTYDYDNYSFTRPAAFGGVEPWGTVQRFGVSLPMHFSLQDGWGVSVAPSLDWFRENGADMGESLVWGAVVAATRRFADGNMIGLGVAAFDQLEETEVLPVFLIDWRFGGGWRISNPLVSGPTGPAGLELGYQFDNGWSLGLGGALRKKRFRLSEDGPVPNGVGEERGVPVFLHASRSFGAQFSLDLYAGVVTGGRLRVENSSGNLIREDDYDTAPLLSVTFTGRF